MSHSGVWVNLSHHRQLAGHAYEELLPVYDRYERLAVKGKLLSWQRLLLLLLLTPIAPFSTGDRLDTDILWGIQNGVGTCCVLTGARRCALHPGIHAIMHVVHSTCGSQAFTCGSCDHRAGGWRQQRCMGRPCCKHYTATYLSQRNGTVGLRTKGEAMAASWGFLHPHS